MTPPSPYPLPEGEGAYFCWRGKLSILSPRQRWRIAPDEGDSGRGCQVLSRESILRPIPHPKDRPQPQLLRRVNHALARSLRIKQAIGFFGLLELPAMGEQMID